MLATATTPPADTAVLFSGGLDSAVLLAHEARGRRVMPVYVSTGLAWEADERTMIDRLVSESTRTGGFPRGIDPVHYLDLTVRDVYPDTHWAVLGTPPAYDTPDEDVYLHGRNVVLLSKAGLVCAMRGMDRIVLGPLAGNPFPDATPEFFDAMSKALSLGLARRISIEAPFAAMRKAQVIALGAELGVPLELTLSCMNPTEGQHCGLCSKCRERRDAFAEAGIGDPTVYRHASPR